LSKTITRPRAPKVLEEALRFLSNLVDYLLRPEHDIIGLKDGVTAPETKAGVAQMYVDTADGDLKIKFGDGTVKTITVDT